MTIEESLESFRTGVGRRNVVPPPRDSRSMMSLILPQENL